MMISCGFSDMTLCNFAISDALTYPEEIGFSTVGLTKYYYFQLLEKCETTKDCFIKNVIVFDALTNEEKNLGNKF